MASYHVVKRGRRYSIVIETRDEYNNRREIWRALVGKDGRGITTLKEANAAAAQVFAEWQQGQYVPPLGMKLSECVKLYMESHNTLRAKTLQQYEFLAAQYLSRLGHLRVDQITPAIIQRWELDLLSHGGRDGRPLSPKTVRNAHTLLSAVLGQAVQWQMVRQNPVRGVKPPKIERHEQHILMAEQVRSLLAQLRGHRLYALFYLLVLRGMRPGEALGLKWSDVDLRRASMTLRRQLVRPGPRHWQFADLKTLQSRRTIYLPADAVAVLKEHRARQAEEKLKAGPYYTDLDLVFAAPDGRPLWERNIVRRVFKPALIRAGLDPSIRLYDLRHTCATLLLEAGENPKVVADLLGHSSVTITLDTYSHVTPRLRAQAGDKLAELFRIPEDSKRIAKPQNE